MNLSNWFKQDITFCATKNCPIREYCHRAVGCKKRIASYADFGNECNLSNIYKMFMQADMKDVEAYREKNKK